MTKKKRKKNVGGYQWRGDCGRPLPCYCACPHGKAVAGVPAGLHHHSSDACPPTPARLKKGSNK